jgi:tetratricopeptide (TPR) repeat protein
LNKYKICVYAICKNEERFVDRWMDVVSEADRVVVLDTGSTDGTVDRLRARGAEVYTESIIPWRFDAARNRAMDHIPEDVDICISNDLDEVFQAGWRQKLEATWQPEHTRARYLFTCSYNSDGTPNKRYAMEKIHRRHGFRWVHPVHEVLEYTGKDEDKTVWVNGLILDHYPDTSKSRGQYLPLLELSAEENPDNDRIVFWLGREYMYYGKYDDCIATLKKHLNLPTALWDEERCASMRFIAKSYQLKKDYRQSRIWLYKAIAECPGIREPYVQMARLGYLEGDWPLVYLMVNEGLKIINQSGSYLVELDGWGYVLYDMGAISSYRLGLYEKAYGYAQEACKMSPGDERLKSNLELIKEKL